MTLRIAALIALGLLSVSVSILAHSAISALPRAAASASPQTQSDGQPVRIGVTLVQIDAVVTDKQGGVVTGLKPGDFEVAVDGKRQAVTNFSFINTSSSRESASPVSSSPTTITAPRIETRLTPDQVRRTIVLVVDDIGLSFESMTLVRRGLKDFIERQMEPGDLVAIVRTGGGAGALQQFTSNKQQLESVVDELYGSISGWGRISAIDSITDKALPTVLGTVPGTGAVDREDSRLDRFRKVIYQKASLDALAFIIQGLRDMPGRKSLVLFSDGLRLYRDEDHPDIYVADQIRRIVDLASRASVVINTVNSKGLQTIGPSLSDRILPGAEDRVPGRTPGTFQPLTPYLMQMQNRQLGFLADQQGLEYLAGETGGLTEQEGNDLGLAIDRIVRGANGYYLIGFVPDESVFKAVNGRRPFHSNTVKVKKAGLHVRSRKAFLGETDEEAEPSRPSGSNELVAALASPFAVQNVQVQLTSLFWNSSKDGSFIYSLLHIDPSHMTFSGDGDGWHKASFDVAEIVFGDQGRVIGGVTKTQTVRVSDAGYEYILQHGLAFADRFPLKASGALQFRVGVKDAASGQIGTASSFVDAPDLKDGRMVLSGLFLRAGAGSSAAPSESASPGALEPQSGATQLDADPAIRVFLPGGSLALSFVIYNANAAAAGNQGLTLQVHLYRDGNLVYAGPATPFNPAGQGDPARLGVQMSFKLGDGLAPGSYILQAVCAEKQPKGNPVLAAQSIDLQIVR